MAMDAGFAAWSSTAFAQTTIIEGPESSWKLGALGQAARRAPRMSRRGIPGLELLNFLLTETGSPPKS